MGKEAKTNAMRMLDRKKVKYEAIAYDCGEFIDGIHCADITGAPHDQSFKTLVMEGKSGGYYVFVVPIEKEVDRKAAAKSVGEKTVDMIHVKDLTKITGYIRGGCSPLGMKKLYKGVRVDVVDNTVMVDLSIILRINENIVTISKKVQDKVKTTVENMTGMEVANVNVNIASVATN